MTPAGSTCSSAAAAAAKATPAAAGSIFQPGRRSDADLRRRMGEEDSRPAWAWRTAKPSKAKWSAAASKPLRRNVEERNFEIRKNLLEYDEVMDEQRKAHLQLPPADLSTVHNTRDLICGMIEEQVDHHLDTFLRTRFWRETLCQLGRRPLWATFDNRRTFRGTDIHEPLKPVAKDEAVRQAESQISSAQSKRTSPTAKKTANSDWNWSALGQVRQPEIRISTTATERPQERIGRDDLAEKLTADADEAINRRRSFRRRAVFSTKISVRNRTAIGPGRRHKFEQSNLKSARSRWRWETASSKTEFTAARDRKRMTPKKPSTPCWPQCTASPRAAAAVSRGSIAKRSVLNGLRTASKRQINGRRTSRSSNLRKSAKNWSATPPSYQQRPRAR